MAMRSRYAGLSIGDTVRLRSGGPAMVVRDRDLSMLNHYVCDWFDAEGRKCSDSFHGRQLEPA